tara:strand:+ start:1184 stop:1510 length:327 start_codon:yes stop_codon:yes gene_type:complete
MGNNKLNHCSWCGAPTKMEKLLMPDTPILEQQEEMINKLGRKRVWGEGSDWSNIKMDSNTEAELLVYDQLLSSVSLKHICSRCIVEDEKLYRKYYNDPDDAIVFDAEF